MQEISYKVYLYKPEAASETVDNAAAYFLGELIVDNLQVDIRLQDISTISFSIPRKINDIVNTRIDEVLDSYVIELWYGDLTGSFNQDYFKYRFVIYSTPLSFTDDKFIHNYQGFSLESLLEIKKVISWPGIEISDYFRKLTYNNNGTTSKFLEAKDTGVGGNFEYTLSTSSNAHAQKYISITPTLATITDLDIFIYELRENLIAGQEAETESGLIPLNGAAGISDDGTGVNNNAFKQGYYYLTISGGYVTAVHIALPDTYVNYNGVSTSDKTLSFKYYDNPLSRRYAIGLVTNEPEANDMYIDLAHDAALGNATNYDDYNFKTQQFYSKNGLTLKQVLLGKEDTSTATVTEDGLLYNTNFTIDQIDASLLTLYRSNLEFNNVSRYEAIKTLAESFDAIAVFNSADNTVSFYPENEYGQNNGLIFRYGAYLKSLQKEIDASKIITNAVGLGKDNLTISLVNPTGLNYWEDYSYYLDDYYIDPSQTTADLISAGFSVSVDGTKGLSITYPAGTYSSRWMSATQAQKIGAWQYTRDYFHKILLGEINPTGGFSSYARYYDLYETRIEAIRELVKKETEHLNLLKKVKKLETFKNYYYRLHLNNPTNSTYETKYNNYLADYNDENTAANNFYNNIILPLKDEIFDETEADSIADKMSEVVAFLEKVTAHTIDTDALRPFQRETVVTDSKVDTEIDLLDIVKTHVDENKEPKVTISVDVADILAAEEAKEDWSKVKIGDKINIYLEEFNIDVVAQIREISVNFQERTLSLTISTVRNYNKGFGNFVLKKIRSLNDSNENNVNFEVDGIRDSRGTSGRIKNILENGLSTTNTDVTSGATDKDENPSTVTNSAGTTIAAISAVDELTETVTFESLSTEGIVISDGSILAYKSYTSPTAYTSQVEISADTGFTVRKIDNAGDITNQVYIDTSGNAVFSGFLSVGQTTVGYDQTGVFLGVDSSDPKVSFKSDSTTFFKYDPSANYDLEIAGNAKIGPLFVGNTGSSTSSLTTSNSGLVYYSGANPITNISSSTTFNFADTSGQELVGGTVTLSAYSGSAIIATITAYDGINGTGNNLGSFDTDDLTTISGSGGFIIGYNIRNVKSISIGVSSSNVLSTWTLPLANITITTYKPSLQINNFTVNSSGELTSSKLTVNTSTTIGRDSITILPATVGTTFKNMVLSTPTGGLTLSRTIRLPDANGTIALNDATQTFSAVKTFSAEPVFTAGAVFGSAADAANSIEITASGNIIFEGSSADANETTLTAANPSADRTITLPNATGTVAITSQSDGSVLGSWTLIHNATATLTSTDATTVSTVTLDTGTVTNTDTIVLQVDASNSSTSSTYEKAYIFVRLGTNQTTANTPLTSWTALDSSTTGNPRLWSMLVRYNSSTQIDFRYVGYNTIQTAANKTFGTVYVHKIWKVTV